MPELSITDIRANPDQPRKHFDENKLRELAASIREHGLMQPITVRPAGDGNYVLVAGERRYRAHVIAGFPTIRAEIVEIDDQAAAEQAIVENLQRVDISPLEEAAAYQSMLDRYGYTVEQLANRIGMKQPWRISERTSLLNLDPAYQQLLAKGQIGSSQAYEMSRLGARGQATLFKAIRRGDCPTYDALRAQATAIVEAESQSAFFDDDEAPAISDDDVAAATRFERKIETVAAMLAAGFKDNEIVALHKVNPTNAATLADKMVLMQRDLKTLEMALRKAAVQLELRRAS